MLLWCLKSTFILLDSSLVLKGKIKLSSWSLPKASNHSAWQEAVVKPFSLLLLEVSLSINNYPPFAERAMWTPSQTSILKSSPLWNIGICKNHQSIVLTKWKQVSVNHIWMYSSKQHSLTCKAHLFHDQPFLKLRIPILSYFAHNSNLDCKQGPVRKQNQMQLS